MMPKKVNVLGTDYEIIFSNEKEMPEIFNDRDAQIDDSIKQILINNFEDKKGDPNYNDDPDYLIQKNIRHELTHAFLYESGLAENSDWAQNEEMVDWIARQFPKMVKTFKEVNAI